MATTDRAQSGPEDHRSFLGRRFAAGAVLVVGALVLRFWHLRFGLPDFFEEAIPFREALQMWGWETGRFDPNPHFFNYPTLTLYLHLLIQKGHYLVGSWLGVFAGPADFWFMQQTDPTDSVWLARCLGVMADGATMVAVWRLGERLRRGAGLLALLMVGASAILIVTSRSIFVEPILTALGIWAVERLDAWNRQGRRRQLLLALVFIGLAAGAKYNGGLLVLPLAAVLWNRHRWSGLLRWPAAVLASVAVFFITSPYILVDFGSFLAHFGFESEHMASGHLGTAGRHGAGFMLESLGRDLGWPLLAVALGGVAGLRKGWPSGGLSGRGLIWVALVPMLMSVALFKMEATRYAAPLVPLLCVVTADNLLRIERWARQNCNRQLVLGLRGILVVLMAPAIWSGLVAGASGASSTRIQAQEWIESRIGPRQTLVQEAYGIPLLDSYQRRKIVRHHLFPAVTAGPRQAFLERRVYHTVSLPLAASGRITVQVLAVGGTLGPVAVFEPADRINGLFYEPSLLSVTDYFVTSGAVRERYMASTSDYPSQREFYEHLEDRGELVATFADEHPSSGPTLKIYRLRPTRDAPGPTQFWWADGVPDAYRQAYLTLKTGNRSETIPRVHKSGGEPQDWVVDLEPLYSQMILPYELRMARQQADVGRWSSVRDRAASILAMRPELVSAGILFSRSSLALGEPQVAMPVVENAIELGRSAGQDIRGLRVEQARLLHALGQFDAAIAILEEIRDGLPAGTDPYRQLEDQLSRWKLETAR